MKSLKARSRFHLHGKAIRRTRKSIAGAVFVLFAMLGLSIPVNASAASQLVAVTVPEIGCLTSFAADGGLWSPTVPSQAHLHVHRADLGAFASLALYVSATLGPNDTVAKGLEVLAPRGWYCVGTQGADGNAYVFAMPIVQACTGYSDGRCDQFSTNPSSRPQSVRLSFLDLGSMISTLCDWAYFAKVFCPIAPGKEHSVAYPGEVVKVLGRWSLGYEDPPGVHGHGSASGGWDPDNGVVIFVPPPPSWKVDGTTYKADPPGTRAYFYEGAAYESGCTLPAAEHAWCSAILNSVLNGATS